MMFQLFFLYLMVQLIFTKKKNFLYHKLVVNVFVTKEHEYINNKAPTEIILKTVCSLIYHYGDNPYAMPSHISYAL